MNLIAKPKEWNTMLGLQSQIDAKLLSQNDKLKMQINFTWKN